MPPLISSTGTDLWRQCPGPLISQAVMEPLYSPQTLTFTFTFCKLHNDLCLQNIIWYDVFSVKVLSVVVLSHWLLDFLDYFQHVILVSYYQCHKQAIPLYYDEAFHSNWQPIQQTMHIFWILYAIQSMEVATKYGYAALSHLHGIMSNKCVMCAQQCRCFTHLIVCLWWNYNCWEWSHHFHTVYYWSMCSYSK